MTQNYKDALSKNRSYDDIIDMPHHVSTKRAQMSMHDRAAQFAPFSALVGYEEAIEKTCEENLKEMSKK